MVVGGNVKTEEVKKLAEKWFEPIPSGNKYQRNLPAEPLQIEAKTLTVNANVPLNAIYIAFKMPARNHESYQVFDLLSDILSQGQSSRLYNTLLKEQQLFSDINAYITSSLDEGLFVVEGKLIEGVEMEKAEEAIWTELLKLTQNYVSTDELTKVKNKAESIMVFAEMNLLDKAMNLAYYELLGDANLLNIEIDKYLAITAEQIKDAAATTFVKQKSSTLYYLANA
jgi:predicted Zn-dependent peptidase